jgi:DNA-binding ferritin-like protein (Dps family)
MKQNVNQRLNQKLVSNIHETNKKQIPHRNIINPKTWRKCLTDEAICHVNEAWSKFVYSESLLSESLRRTTSPSFRWNVFVESDDNLKMLLKKINNAVETSSKLMIESKRSSIDENQSLLRINDSQKTQKTMTLSSHLLVSNLYESFGKSSVARRARLINREKWNLSIPLSDINRINEAYRKFIFSESLLLISEQSNTVPRARLFEQFLQLEDLQNSLNSKVIKRPLLELWDDIKKGAKKALRWAKGETRKTHRGGSFLGMGSKSKAQEKQFERLKAEQGNLMAILEKETTKINSDYPNNESYTEFVDSTLKALQAASDFIGENGKTPDERAAMFKALKQWISYLMDQKVSDKYKRVTGAKEGEVVADKKDALKKKKAAGSEEIPHLNSANEIFSRYEELIFEAAAEDGDSLATKKNESEEWKELNNKTIPAILNVLGKAGIAVGAVTGLAQFIAAHWALIAGWLFQEPPTEEEYKRLTKTTEDVTLGGEGHQYMHDQVGKYLKFDPASTSREEFVDMLTKQYGSLEKGVDKMLDVSKVDTSTSNNHDFLMKVLTDQEHAGDSVKDIMDIGKTASGQHSWLESMKNGPGKAGTWTAARVVWKLITDKRIREGAIAVIPAAIANLAAIPVAAAAGLAVTGVLSLVAGKWVKRSRENAMKSSRIQYLNDLFDDVETMEKGEDAGPIPTPPPVPPQPVPLPPPPEPEPEEENCSPEEMKKKLLDALKKTKYKSDMHEKIADGIVAALKDKEIKNIDDIVNAIKTKYRKMKPATEKMLADAIADCFGLSGTGEEEPEEEEDKAEEKEVKNISGGEVASMVDNVMKDLNMYKEKVDGKYRTDISRDKVEELIKYLNSKGKLSFDNYNSDDSTITGIMDKIKGPPNGLPKSPEQKDDMFMKNIPPAYKSIPDQWVRKQGDIAADVSKILGGNSLPMNMLALRRGLVETITKSIFKHARILHENKRNDVLIIARWNRLAGILT